MVYCVVCGVLSAVWGNGKRVVGDAPVIICSVVSCNLSAVLCCGSGGCGCC